MLELPKGLNPEKREESEGRRQGEGGAGGRPGEGRQGDARNRLGGFSTLLFLLHLSSSHLGQDPAPIKWERQLAKLLPQAPSFLLGAHGQMVSSTITHATDAGAMVLAGVSSTGERTWDWAGRGTDP